MQMLKEIRQNNQIEGDSAFDEYRSFDLRATIEGSIDLPAEVLRTDFSQIHDRILDRDVLSGLIESSTADTETVDQSKRRRHRKQMMLPYLGKRLVCVCIQLPGVVYTIEIDPEADQVVHWEWQSI